MSVRLGIIRGPKVKGTSSRCQPIFSQSYSCAVARHLDQTAHHKVAPLRKCLRVLALEGLKAKTQADPLMCEACGASVLSVDIHTGWHAFLEREVKAKADAK